MRSSSFGARECLSVYRIICWLRVQSRLTWSRFAMSPRSQNRRLFTVRTECTQSLVNLLGSALFVQLPVTTGGGRPGARLTCTRICNFLQYCVDVKGFTSIKRTAALLGVVAAFTHIIAALRILWRRMTWSDNDLFQIWHRNTREFDSTTAFQLLQ